MCGRYVQGAEEGVAYSIEEGVAVAAAVGVYSISGRRERLWVCTVLAEEMREAVGLYSINRRRESSCGCV